MNNYKVIDSGVWVTIFIIVTHYILGLPIYNIGLSLSCFLSIRDLNLSSRIDRGWIVLFWGSVGFILASMTTQAGLLSFFSSEVMYFLILCASSAVIYSSLLLSPDIVVMGRLLLSAYSSHNYSLPLVLTLSSIAARILSMGIGIVSAWLSGYIVRPKRLLGKIMVLLDRIKDRYESCFNSVLEEQGIGSNVLQAVDLDIDQLTLLCTSDIDNNDISASQKDSLFRFIRLSREAYYFIEGYKYTMTYKLDMKDFLYGKVIYLRTKLDEYHNISRSFSLHEQVG